MRFFHIDFSVPFAKESQSLGSPLIQKKFIQILRSKCRKYSENHRNQLRVRLKNLFIEKRKNSSGKEFQRFEFGLTLMKAKNNNIDSEGI